LGSISTSSWHLTGPSERQERTVWVHCPSAARAHEAVNRPSRSSPGQAGDVTAGAADDGTAGSQRRRAVQPVPGDRRRRVSSSIHHRPKGTMTPVVRRTKRIRGGPIGGRVRRARLFVWRFSSPSNSEVSPPPAISRSGDNQPEFAIVGAVFAKTWPNADMAKVRTQFARPQRSWLDLRNSQFRSGDLAAIRICSCPVHAQYWGRPEWHQLKA
jgi:hypothetical protein